MWLIDKIMRYVLAFLFSLAQGLTSAVAQECASCHAQEHQAWKTSQHALAMQAANSTSVLADFPSSYKDEQVSARFQVQNGKYLVHLKEQGEPEALWTIRYVIGVEPLQQYLIEIGDGKVQALNIAWDTRPRDEGGENWFRLDQQTPQTAGHPLHWQGIYQNWNGMCADCHVTDFKKNYELSLDRFRSQWNAINVSCSACHEKAEEHERRALIGDYVSAGEAIQSNIFVPGRSATAVPRAITEKNVDNTTLTCGRCHSLRTKLHSGEGLKIGEDYSLTRLFSPLYTAEGHVNDEAYVLGSFMQSRMYQAGVTCTNCHNPHTGKLLLPNNGVCLQCHETSVYEQTTHHKHQLGKAGAMCVDCHMPEQTFMTIDRRREHSFSIPVITPNNPNNECLACHQDKDEAWSRAAFAELWPNHLSKTHWSGYKSNIGQTVLDYIRNQQEPELRRATLIEENAELIAQQAAPLLLNLLEDDGDLIRESAWRAAALLAPEDLTDKIELGLNDPLLAIRLSAFQTLSTLKVDTSRRPESEEEYRDYLDQISDRPSGLVLRANFDISYARYEEALQHLKKAIEMDRYYSPARIQLIELYRAQERFDAAMQVIKEGLSLDQEKPMLTHYKGLIELKQKHYDRALMSLKTAAYAAPESFVFAYRYIVALTLLNHHQEAISELQWAKQRFPEQPEWRAVEKRLSPSLKY